MLSAQQFSHRFDPKDYGNWVHARQILDGAIKQPSNAWLTKEMPYHMQPFQAGGLEPYDIEPVEA